MVLRKCFSPQPGQIILPIFSAAHFQYCQGICAAIQPSNPSAFGFEEISPHSPVVFFGPVFLPFLILLVINGAQS